VKENCVVVNLEASLEGEEDVVVRTALDFEWATPHFRTMS